MKSKSVHVCETHLFIFKPAFPLRSVAEAADLSGLEIPNHQQKSEVVPLTPRHDGTKRGRRCSHTTWALYDLWAACPWVDSVA